MYRDKYIPREEYVKLPFEKRLIELGDSEDERAKRLGEKYISVDLHCLTYHQFSDKGESQYPRKRVENSGLTCIAETVDDFGHNPNHEFQIVVKDVWFFTEFFPKMQGIEIAIQLRILGRRRKRVSKLPFSPSRWMVLR